MKVEPGNEKDAFDAITFSKAAAILRMIREYVGQKQFQSAISSYLLNVGAKKNSVRHSLEPGIYVQNFKMKL